MFLTLTFKCELINVTENVSVGFVFGNFFLFIQNQQKLSRPNAVQAVQFFFPTTIYALRTSNLKTKFVILFDSILQFNRII
jgi:hypothetical protein